MLRQQYRKPSQRGDRRKIKLHKNVFQLLSEGEQFYSHILWATLNTAATTATTTIIKTTHNITSAAHYYATDDPATASADQKIMIYTMNIQ